MQRRQVILGSVTGVGLTWLAGCLSSIDESDGTDDGSGNGGDANYGNQRVFNPPDARFSIEFPGLSNPRTHTVTYDSGDAIEARELFIRGTGIIDGHTGAFHEIDGSGLEPDDEVSPGYSLNITVEDEDAAHSITVRWKSAETGDSTFFASHESSATRSG